MPECSHSNFFHSSAEVAFEKTSRKAVPMRMCNNNEYDTLLEDIDVRLFYKLKNILICHSDCFCDCISLAYG